MSIVCGGVDIMDHVFKSKHHYYCVCVTFTAFIQINSPNILKCFYIAYIFE